MYISDRIFSLYWNIKIYQGKSVEEGVVIASSFSPTKLYQGNKISFILRDGKKAYTQKQWLHINEEILHITKFLLDFFVGIQYTMLQILSKNVWRAKNKEVWLLQQKLNCTVNCPNCCDESNLCRYLQLAWGRWVLLFSCMYKLLWQMVWSETT